MAAPLHSSPQANVPGRGIVASYSKRFWTLVALVGVAAGLGGAALTELLRLVQHLAWQYPAHAPIEGATFLHAVEATSSGRRVAVLAIGGAVAGSCAIAFAQLGGGEIGESVWLRDGRLPLLGSIARAVESVVIVGLGASLGREAAPQQTGAAVAAALGQRSPIPGWQRRLLVACGAGAGMAAVYNVPLGGALFALEVLLGSLALPLVLPALATSTIATGVAWIALPTHSLYVLPAYRVSAAFVVFGLIVGPLAGIAAIAYVRLIARAGALRPSGGVRAVAAPLVAFTSLGLVAIAYPQLLGNGRNVVQLALLGGLGASLLAILAALKPIATAACLGSGAPGGLFTPTLAFGVLFAGLLGAGWGQLWPGSPAGGYALIGGTAVLAAAMQGPLAALVLILELTRQADSLIVPMVVAVVEATVLARVVGVPSIYTARLSTT